MSTRLSRLKRRPDFVRIARTGRSKAMPGLVLQCAPRECDGVVAMMCAGPRIGFTASRRVGGAVARNRARRRLRAVADLVMAQQARPDCDYVLIARATTAGRSFEALKSDLHRALDKLDALRTTTDRARGP